MASSPSARPSASARVYARLKADILEGRQVGGSFITEGEVAASTGVSRTPVREALLRLEADGLLRLYPKKGALVVPVSAAEAREVLEARLVIEHWAAAAMWSRRADVLPELARHLDEMRGARQANDLAAFVEHDRRFHEAIVATAGNSVLTRTYQGLRDRQLTIIIATQMRMSGERLDSALHGHAELVDLLRTGTKAAFVAATRAHVSDAIARLQSSR